MLSLFGSYPFVFVPSVLALRPLLSMTSVPARPSAAPTFSGLKEFGILKAKHKLSPVYFLTSPYVQSVDTYTVKTRQTRHGTTHWFASTMTLFERGMHCAI